MHINKARLDISNPSTLPVTFEAFPNRPSRYTVSPARGTVAAGASTAIEVAVRNEREAADLLAHWKATGKAHRDSVAVVTEGRAAHEVR